MCTIQEIGEAIEQRHIDPSKCFLLDFDTDSNGILQKIDFAQPLERRAAR